MTLRKEITEPQPEKKRLNTYLDAVDYSDLEEIASITKRSLNFVANEAYKAYSKANLAKLRKSLKQH